MCSSILQVVSQWAQLDFCLSATSATCVHTLCFISLQPHQTVYYFESVACKRFYTCTRSFQRIGTQRDINALAQRTIFKQMPGWLYSILLSPSPAADVHIIFVTWLEPQWCTVLNLLLVNVVHRQNTLQMHLCSKGHQLGSVRHHFGVNARWPLLDNAVGVAGCWRAHPL